MTEEIKQNTPEWMAWRAKGIGASEAPIILGISLYKTALELWEEKTNPTAPKEKENNFVQAKGHRLEEVARAKYETDSFPDEFPATLVEHADHPFLRASLDGYCKRANHHIECKYMGNKGYDKVNSEADLIEHYPHYYCQIQYQLMITNGTGSLLKINDKNEIKEIPIQKNEQYFLEMMPKIFAFREAVETKTKPELSADDFMLIRNKDLKKKLKRYQVIKRKLDALSAEEEEIKDFVKANMEHPKMIWGKFELTTIERQGNVNYKNIPELKGVDLEKYRAKPSVYNKITVKK